MEFLLLIFRSLVTLIGAIGAMFVLGTVCDNVKWLDELKGKPEDMLYFTTLLLSIMSGLWCSDMFTRLVK